MGGSPYGSAAGSPGGAARRSDVSHSLRPLTVCQLLNATQAHSDAEWMLEDTEIGHVTCVAHVVSIQSQATNKVYWLDDGTGRIEARHWTDSSMEDSPDKAARVKDGSYVRVLGNLKMFGTKRYINVNQIRPTKSADEIYFHLLEVMTVTLMWERGPPLRPGQQAHEIVGSHAVAHSGYAIQSNADLINSQWAHLPELSQKILHFMKNQPETAEGVNSTAIARAMQTNAMAIDQAMEQLMDDGLIFSTIDEMHFKLAM